MSSYIRISVCPQTNSERNNFINVVQDACTNAYEILEDMRFLNSAVNLVPCEYVMIQEALLNYMYGDICYVGLIDTNHK